MRVDLTILGEPMGKQRPRYSNYGGFVRTYTPQKTINYESLIAHEYNEKYGKVVRRIVVDPIEMSSSEVRACLKDGKNVSRMLLPSVEKYISDNHLYV